MYAMYSHCDRFVAFGRVSRLVLLVALRIALHLSLGVVHTRKNYDSVDPKHDLVEDQRDP